MNENRQLRFRTHTLGCKVNLYESEAIASDLAEHGWIHTERNEETDVHIINTCTVTKMSDAKSRKMIRSLIRQNPEAIIVVMGCYAQMAPGEVAEIDGVDIILGNRGKNKVKEYVYEYLDNKKQQNHIVSSNEITDYEELKVGRLTNHTRGFIKIQDGCENFCSYCAIPYARGPIRSRAYPDVIEEIKSLVSTGVKEVILSGINTGTYGHDQKETNITLAKLIKMILDEVPGLMRLRLSSIELMEISPELLSLFDETDRLAHQLHIPLQAGSDSVLKRMNRRYTTAEYRKVIEDIKTRFSDMAITTDCLAGFVGETEEEHKEAIAFINEMGFAMMHVFPYSRRSGTAADSFSGHLSKELIEERTHNLIKLANALRNDFIDRFIGTKQVVLFEQFKNGYWKGYTSNYIEVQVESDIDLTNKLYHVYLEKHDGEKIIGKLEKEVRS